MTASGRRPPAPVQAASTTAEADRDLVRRVAAGDASALEAVYARHGRSCYGLARRVLGDEQLAQDVVQEVFLVLWRDARRFDAARGSLSSWLLTLTHHKAVDAVRREENLRKRHTAAERLEAAAPSPLEPHDQVWTSVRGERVRAALGELTEQQREALVLAYFGGYTQREIAGLTGTPLGTVKTRMLAGMRRLRTGLDGLADATDTTGTPDTGLAGGAS
jgi:RNA polymerase sigma factor (sigma-70 family)